MMCRKRPQHFARAAALSLFIALTPAAMAAAINVDAMFAANDRSIWTGSGGTSVDKSGFLGPNAWNVGASFPPGGMGEKCVFGFCIPFGVEVGARTSGRVGIDYGLKLDSGTFDVHYPARASFNVPDSVPGLPGVPPTVTIGTSLSALPGGLGLPDQPGGPVTLRTGTLQVRGPDLQAHLDMIAEMTAFAGASVCVGICYGPKLGPLGFNESKEIVALNRNGDGKIRLAGDTLVNANQSVSALGGLIVGNFSLPDLDASGGFNGDKLAASDRDRIAALKVNIAQIVAKAVGLPFPLSGKVGPIGYNLLEAGSGAFLDLRETLEFTPSAVAQLIFSAPVLPVINGVQQAATTVMDNIRLGDQVSFTPLNLGSVGVEPIITLGGHVTNRLELMIGGNVDVKALGVNIAGLSVGPLINERFGGDSSTIDIPLLTTEFELGLGTVAGRPFNMSFAECVAIFGHDEFGNREGVCAVSGFGGGAAFADGDGYLVGELSRFGCTAYEFGHEEDLSCFDFPGGFTSPYFPSPFGDTFIGSGDARTFQKVLPGESASDASGYAALAALGEGGASPFIIPEGDPFSAFPAPEPASLALFGLGFAGLLVGRASRTRRGRKEPRLSEARYPGRIT